MFEKAKDTRLLSPVLNAFNFCTEKVLKSYQKSLINKQIEEEDYYNEVKSDWGYHEKTENRIQGLRVRALKIGQKRESINNKRA